MAAAASVAASWFNCCDWHALLLGALLTDVGEEANLLLVDEGVCGGGCETLGGAELWRESSGGQQRPFIEGCCGALCGTCCCCV